MIYVKKSWSRRRWTEVCRGQLLPQTNRREHWVTPPDKAKLHFPKPDGSMRCLVLVGHVSNTSRTQKFYVNKSKPWLDHFKNVWTEGNYVSSPGCSDPHSISTPSKPLTAPVVFWVPVNFINQLIVLINVMQQLLRYGSGLLAIWGLCVEAKGTHQEWKVPQPAKEGGRVFSRFNLGMTSQWYCLFKVQSSTVNFERLVLFWAHRTLGRKGWTPGLLTSL